MITLEDAARKIHNQYLQDTQNNNEIEVFFDPGTLMIIASVLSIVFNGIRLYCLLKKELGTTDETEGSQVKKLLVNQPLQSRLHIRRALKQKLSPTDFRKHHRQFTDAILKSGHAATDEELTQLMSQVPESE